MPASSTEAKAVTSDFIIKAHEDQGALFERTQRPIQFLIQETAGEQREVWVDETVLPEDLVSEYLREVGKERLAQAAVKRANKRNKRKADAAQIQETMAKLSGECNNLTEDERMQAMQDRSTAEDLGAVACGTHKE